MSEPLKRYECTDDNKPYGLHRAIMEEDPHGDFYLASDADARITELERAVKVLAEEVQLIRQRISEFQIFTHPHIGGCTTRGCGCHIASARIAVDTNPIASQAIADARKGSFSTP